MRDIETNPGFYTTWHMQNDDDRSKRIMRGIVMLFVQQFPPVCLAVEVSASWIGSPMEQAKMASLAEKQGQRVLAATYEKLTKGLENACKSASE